MNVPLSVKLNPEEVKFRLNHSESRMILTSSIQAVKVKEVIKECRTLEKIIHFDTQEEYSSNEIHFNEIRKIGREWLDTPGNMTKFEENYKSIQPSDFANICYTSSRSKRYHSHSWQLYIKCLPGIQSDGYSFILQDSSYSSMGSLLRAHMRHFCLHGKRSQYRFCKNR